MKTDNETKVILLIIAGFIALNNAYQTFGTNYHIMYWSWISVAVVLHIIALIKFFNGRK